MTQTYKVQVSMNQAHIVKTGLVLKQGDFGMQIEIEVLDFNVSGTTPQIIFRKPQGSVESTSITVSSNKYTYTFAGTELDIPGHVVCDLKLKNSTTQRISTASFMFEVIADTLDGLTEQASSYSDTVEQLISRYDGDIDALQTAIGNTIDLTGLSWTNGCINSSGEVQAMTNDYASGYIPVGSPSTIKFEHVDIRTNRCIYGYDSNKSPKALLVQGDSSTYSVPDSTISVNIPAGVAYVRLTRHNSVSSVNLSYISINDALYNTAGVINTEIGAINTDIGTINSNIGTINSAITNINETIGGGIDTSQVTWETGKIGTTGNAETEQNDRASDYIPVQSPSTILFEHVDIRTTRCIYGYDSAKNPKVLLVEGNTTTYPTVDSTVSVSIPAGVAYVRVTRHSSISAIKMSYRDISDSIYAAAQSIYDKLLDGRTGIKLTPLGKYSNENSFDPVVSMPYNTWWTGAYSLVKDALTTGSLSGCPLVVPDVYTIRLEKYEMLGGQGALYKLFSNAGVAICSISYAGAKSWKQFVLLSDDTIVNSGIYITPDNKSSYFTDANNAPVNSIYEISADAHIANTPYGDGGTTAAGYYTDGVRSFAGYSSGTLWTVKESGGTLTTQFFYACKKVVSGDTLYPIMHYRIKYSAGNWSKWVRMSNEVNLASSGIAIRKKMIAPYVDSEGNPTAEDTGIPNPQYMADDPLIFKDFNDAPQNSIYQIDLDCDATVMAHNPYPGKSSMLLTSGPIYTTRHAIFQICIGLQGGGRTFFCYRYCYMQSSNPVVYVWTDWEQPITQAGQAAYVQNKGRLADGTDLNTILANEIYLLGSSQTYINNPLPSNNAGVFQTFKFDTVLYQTVENIASSTKYSRYSVNTGSTWSEWVS